MGKRENRVVGTAVLAEILLAGLILLAAWLAHT